MNSNSFSFCRAALLIAGNPLQTLKGKKKLIKDPIYWCFLQDFWEPWH